jgi:hypothetical protein
MEARMSFRRTGLPKWMVAAVALTAAIGLALGGGYTIKAVSQPTAKTSQYTPVLAIATGESGYHLIHVGPQTLAGQPQDSSGNRAPLRGHYSRSNR